RAGAPPWFFVSCFSFSAAHRAPHSFPTRRSSDLTSAVCGMPRKEAHEFLQQNEDFDRSFFAGFIGPVNIQEETSIYVNLRTASLKGKSAVLYAGAGVTEDSDPEKEWEETELKCQIIGKFIQTPSA